VSGATGKKSYGWRSGDGAVEQAVSTAIGAWRGSDGRREGRRVVEE
jgi:hypothetical protein